MDIQQIIKQGNCTIVDVRTRSEFQNGHAPGSVNIPLQEVPVKLTELKAMKQPLMLCCASGGRSGQAHAWLADQGIDCHNVGSWVNVRHHLS